jgi:hypothetical protein
VKSVSDFSFQFVEGPVSQEIGEKVIKLWTEFAKISAVEAERRLKELVLVLTYRSGEIIGVSTAVKTHFPQINNYVYAYRCFIHPQFRAPALDTQMIVRTKDHLQRLNVLDPENKCVGIMVVVQNEVLKSQWKQAVWQGAEMIYVGNTQKGHHIRIGYCKGARI